MKNICRDVLGKQTNLSWHFFKHLYFFIWQVLAKELVVVVVVFLDLMLTLPLVCTSLSFALSRGSDQPRSNPIYSNYKKGKQVAPFMLQGMEIQILGQQSVH